MELNLVQHEPSGGEGRITDNIGKSTTGQFPSSIVLSLGFEYITDYDGKKVFRKTKITIWFLKHQSEFGYVE